MDPWVLLRAAILMAGPLIASSLHLVRCALCTSLSPLFTLLAPPSVFCTLNL